MKKTLLFLGILALITPLAFAEVNTNILNLKSDASWKSATGAVSGDDWLSASFDDSTWAASTANWANGPCSVYCGKITSCAVGCNDWMWSGEGCQNCTRYFRKVVNIPGPVITASVTISADDYYWLYVNGNLVGTTEGKRVSYALSDNYDISNLLHTGDNIIAIKAENLQDYQGVSFKSTITYTTQDPIIAQLQAQVSDLQSQISKLTDDKTRLQSQVDSLSADKTVLTASKDQLVSQVSELQLENTNLNTTLAQSDSGLGRYKLMTLVFFIGFLLALIGLGFCLYYINEKTKKKPPALSSPPVVKDKERLIPPKERATIKEATAEGRHASPTEKVNPIASLREEGRSSGSKLFP